MAPTPSRRLIGLTLRGASSEGRGRGVELKARRSGEAIIWTHAGNWGRADIAERGGHAHFVAQGEHCAIANNALNFAIAPLHFLTFSEEAPMAGFAREAIANVNDWQNVERFNGILQQLLARRTREVEPVGALLKSKTAWKCAVLQQSLLYRSTALANGTADAWNAGNVVCAVLCARALVETIAISVYLKDELQRLIAARDADALDALANKHLFATRNEQAVADGYGHMATNILSHIDRLDKKIAGARDTYDFLSEWAHPNGSGHFFTFGDLDKQTGKVTFHEVAPRVRGIEGHITTCFMLIAFMELVVQAFDEAIPALADFDRGSGPWVSSQSAWPLDKEKSR